MIKLDDDTLQRGAQEFWIVRVDKNEPYASFLEALESAMRTKLPMRIFAGPHQGAVVLPDQVVRLAKRLAASSWGVERAIALECLGVR